MPEFVQCLFTQSGFSLENLVLLMGRRMASKVCSSKFLFPFFYDYNTSPSWDKGSGKRKTFTLHSTIGIELQLGLLEQASYQVIYVVRSHMLVLDWKGLELETFCRVSLEIYRVR